MFIFVDSIATSHDHPRACISDCGETGMKFEKKNKRWGQLAERSRRRGVTRCRRSGKLINPTAGSSVATVDLANTHLTPLSRLGVYL